MDELKKYFITSRDDEYVEGKVNVFLSKFSINRSIKSARIFITALGLYEAEINGTKIGNQLFAPGFTYYPKDLFYQSYDITKELSTENNELKIYLGQGWYSGRFTHENLVKIYGDQTAVSWIIEVKFEDGTLAKFVSDESVQEIYSPYLYAGFYDGEIYDRRIKEEQIGCAASYSGKVPSNLTETYLKVIEKEKMPIKEVFDKEGKTIIDFGQNFAGIIEVNCGLLPKDAKIRLRHGEILTQDGELYTDNLRKAKAEIVLYADGQKGTYRPRFTYMGFRYVELTGVDYQYGLLNAKAIYSDMEETGSFSSENKMIDRLFKNQLWGQKSNYVEVPTDCPQRDERMGYTGDGQAYALTGSYNFDTEDFWRKFFKDIRYSQSDNSEGYVAPTVPANGPGGIGFLSMLGWGNAVTIIPEMIYWQYGSKEFQEENYESMKLFIDSEIRHMTDDLWLAPNLGDWLMHGKGMEWMAMNNGPVSNSFIINDLQIMTNLAHRLNKKEDYDKYKNQLEKSTEAYIKTFIDSEGVVQGDYQGGYVMALAYVVRDESLRKKLLSKLVNDVNNNGLNTGFFATEYLLPLLIEAGESKLAYDTLLDESCPGWMYQVKNGATTIWERWDALKEDGSVNDQKVEQRDENMVSFNHYAFGSVGKFYYQYILGIKPLEPGFKKIMIKPYMDERVGSVSGTYKSRAGEISVSWKYQDGKKISVSIKTPQKTYVELPDGQNFEVEPGEYKYVVSN
ncbi:family 78 glycoside hydrolase catalytic domain [Enterococcus sp. AZ196]|uniref:family 78 glycoside hydrolase catalytic domain n=1 Tax=Enterococcus sp. AZ196 TaxID=2774659 RepID=UPI003D2ADC48